MGEEFFTWGNFITWVICSIFIYLALNFRLYMIFHHPGRKLKAKARAQRMRRLAQSAEQPQASHEPAWKGHCVQEPCYAQGGDLSNK